MKFRWKQKIIQYTFSLIFSEFFKLFSSSRAELGDVRHLDSVGVSLLFHLSSSFPFVLNSIEGVDGVEI